MEKLASKLENTRDHLFKAGRDFVDSVTVEAKSWQRYLVSRATRLGDDVIETTTPRSLERRVLVGVGSTLRSIDARVRIRLASIEKRGASRGKKRANGVMKARAAKTARVVSAKPSNAAIAGAPRH